MKRKTTMTDDAKKALAPKLRFPEFGDDAWGLRPLEAVAEFVDERVPVSGISQNEYVSTENIEPGFGGVVPASSFPASGSVVRFETNDILIANIRPYLKKIWLADKGGGASNDVLVVRSREADQYVYLSQALKNDRFVSYVMSGAKGLKMPRGDVGLIREYPVPVPPTSGEQQKIAECLSTLDELIGAESQKLDALKAHKKGLIQQLFPREGETLPRLRFPEFQDAPEWEAKTLGGIATISAGTTPARAEPANYLGGSIPWVKTGDLNNAQITATEECITPKARARVNPAGSVLVAMYGGFAQIGRTGLLAMPAATNQAISVLVVNGKLAAPHYVLAWLNAKVETWKRIASSSRKDPNITGADVERFPISVPAIAEQHRIASCLSSLDDLIAAQSNKIEALKTHKNGLMQQLFPAPAEAAA